MAYAIVNILLIVAIVFVLDAAVVASFVLNMLCVSLTCLYLTLLNFDGKMSNAMRSWASFFEERQASVGGSMRFFDFWKEFGNSLVN